MASKLERVRTALKRNSSITVETSERVFLPGNDGEWSHTVDFYVVPSAKLTNMQLLQAFMVSLVPGLDPSSKHDFVRMGTLTGFGKLCFDEDIGTFSLKGAFTLTDTDLRSHPALIASGLKGNKMVVNRAGALRRRTTVMVFPTAESARAVCEGANEYVVARAFFAAHRAHIRDAAFP